MKVNEQVSSVLVGSFAIHKREYGLEAVTIGVDPALAHATAETSGYVSHAVYFVPFIKTAEVYCFIELIIVSHEKLNAI